FESVAFQMKPRYMVFPALVVVGNARSEEALHCVPDQVSARAVPSSFTRIISFCPAVGVPDGLLIVVAATPCAVITYTSSLSALGDQVAFELIEVTRAVIRLLVRVSVVAFPTRVSVAAGRVSVPLAVAAGCTIVVPLVLPESVTLPSIVPATPTVTPEASHLPRSAIEPALSTVLIVIAEARLA